MIEQILVQKQKQQLLLNPQLQQAIRMLQLPLTELKTAIEQELENNPCLEISESISQSPQELKAEYTPRKTGDDISSFSGQSRQTKPITLEEFLLRQVRLNFDNKQDLQIGELIVGSLNENGYLKIATDEIAQMANTDIQKVEAVLEKIQNFEPVGCASRDIKECLLVQLKAEGKEKSLAYKIVELYLDDLANKRYALLARQLRVDLEQIKSAVKEIGLLEPKPGRQFGYVDKSMYVIPDIFIEKGTKEEYKIIINDREIPRLRINHFYKSLLNKAGISKEERDFIRNRMQAGHAFINSIKMRQETIRKLTEYVVKIQQEFLDKGEEYIKPLSFKQVAQEIGRDESTISRAVNNKYIDTPQGVFKLKALFSTSIKTTSNIDAKEDVSSRSIKKRLRNLIEQEDKTKPLSDQDLLKQLKQEDLKLSRRTIAKYRKELKLLPSYLRKE